MKFTRLTKVLRDFGIEWDAQIGKGSHGAFVGSSHITNIRCVFVLPRSQHTDVQRKYLNGLRRTFELTVDNDVSDELFT